MGNRSNAAATRIDALLCGCLLVVAVGCHAPGSTPAGATARTESRPAARGAVLYAAYCSGCHGTDGRGNGPVAAVLNLRPADLRAPGLLAGAPDDELVGRLQHGTPLRASPRRNAVAEDLQVSALAEYLPTLSGQNWDQLRMGRSVYEETCAPCHGAYGNGEGVLGGVMRRAPADLQKARAHYTDPALAQVVQRGVGAMPPLLGGFEPGEMRALIAYVRYLSKGYRLYDTYCAACHGDDGRGVHPEDLLPPATAAPPLHSATLARLTPAEQRAKILHMLRREQGLMPHFRDTLDERELRDVVAYLRSW